MGAAVRVAVTRGYLPIWAGTASPAKLSGAGTTALGRSIAWGSHEATQFSQAPKPFERAPGGQRTACGSAVAIRLGFDPEARTYLSQRALAQSELWGCAPESLGPMASEVSWDLYRSDGRWHKTYLVAEWPRLQVSSSFLLPLLLGSRCE